MELQIRSCVVCVKNGQFAIIRRVERQLKNLKLSLLRARGRQVHDAAGFCYHDLPSVGRFSQFAAGPLLVLFKLRFESPIVQKLGIIDNLYVGRSRQVQVKRLG